MHYNRLSSFKAYDIDSLLKKHPCFRAIGADPASRLDIYNKTQEEIHALYTPEMVVIPITISSEGQVTFDETSSKTYSLDEDSMVEIRKSLLDFSTIDNPLKVMFEEIFTATERLVIFNIASQLIGDLYNQVNSEEYQFTTNNKEIENRKNFTSYLPLDAYFTFIKGPIREKESVMPLDAYFIATLLKNKSKDYVGILDAYFTYTKVQLINNKEHTLPLDSYFTYEIIGGENEENILPLDGYFEYIVA